jgi:type I restriction enzyme S subunit
MTTELLSEFQTAKFKELIKGKPRHGIYKPPEFSGRGTKIIKMGTQSDNSFINEENIPDFLEVTKEEARRFGVSTDDLLFLRTSLVLEGTGKCSIVKKLREPVVFVSNLIAVTLDKTKANPLFYYYYFSSDSGRQNVLSLCEQTAAATIRSSDLQELTVPFPKLEEQNRIASMLYELDRKIELNQEMNKNLEVIGQAVFKHWFVDFEFPNEEGKPYKSSGGEMVYNKEMAKEIPRIFRVGNIYELCEVIYGYPFSSKYFNRNQTGKPLIRIRDLKTLDSEFYTTEEDSRTTLVKPGDIIAGMDAEFRPYIWLGEVSYLNQRLCMFRPKDNIVHKFFVYETVKPLLKNDEIAKVGTTVIHLCKSDIDRWQVIVPHADSLGKFHRLIAPIFERIVVGSLEIRNLSQIRDFLLHKLMTGKIRVPVQKENGEVQ